MESVIIRNEQLQATIALHGAEVRSVKNVNNHHEYMWSGDAAVWAGVSPVLFPVVGKTTDNQVLWHGKGYPQGNHGFARNALFSVESQSESAVTLAIITNHSDGCSYPFNLRFLVSYELIGAQLLTRYQVENLGAEIAYFSVGAHPAFACPFDGEQQFSDYVIEFEQQENLTRHEITSAAFFTGKTTADALKTIELSTDTFAKDAIVYTGYTSKQIVLREKKSSRAVKVSLNGFPWLGLWSKPGAPYVCIEPWCGHSDMLGFSGEVNGKAAIETVAANSSWSRQFSIEFAY